VYSADLILPRLIDIAPIREKNLYCRICVSSIMALALL